MKGRPSNEVIENRIQVGVELLKEYRFRIGAMQFRKEYKAALIENNLTVPKDSRTISTDIGKIVEKIRDNYDREVQWAAGKVDKPKPNSIFSELGGYVSDMVRKVYLCAGGREYVLCCGNKKFKTMKKFKEPIKELFQLRNDESLSSDTLVHVYIIFSEEGYEEQTSDFFIKNGRQEKVLFTCIHQNCTEIVSELRYLKTMIEDVYYTVFP